MMVKLYESITQNIAAPAEDIQALTDALTASHPSTHQSPHHHEVMAHRAIPMPQSTEPLAQQLPRTFFIDARNKMADDRMQHRLMQLNAERLDSKLDIQKYYAESARTPDTTNVKSDVERRGLMLIKMQRRIRSAITACERHDAVGNRSRTTTKTLRTDNAKLTKAIVRLRGRLAERTEAHRRKEEMRWLTDLKHHRYRFIERHKEIANSRTKIAHAVVSQLERQARDEKRRSEREERTRLALLRTNDEEGYSTLRAVVASHRHLHCSIPYFYV